MVFVQPNTLSSYSFCVPSVCIYLAGVAAGLVTRHCRELSTHSSLQGRLRGIVASYPRTARYRAGYEALSRVIHAQLAAGQVTRHCRELSTHSSLQSRLRGIVATYLRTARLVAAQAFGRHGVQVRVQPALPPVTGETELALR